MIENPCKVVCFGDSLTRAYAGRLEAWLRRTHPSHTITVVNAGVNGETSADGLVRLESVTQGRPQVAVIGFGMNDQDLRVTKLALSKNLKTMIDAFQNVDARVILLTMNPVRGAYDRDANRQIAAYNQVIIDTAFETRVRVADVASEWRRHFRKSSMGLVDALHPNDRGIDVYCEAVGQAIRRRSSIVLWQYNGNPCECNYHCPYCTYDPKTQSGHHFVGTVERWHDAFRCAFGKQRVVFYLAYGEPMIGEKFLDVLDMIGSEPNWFVRMTSNVSLPTHRLASLRVVREKRCEINASYHPAMTTRNRFLQQLLTLRECGIESPVVYVAWPPYLKHLDDDVAFFSEHRFVVHLRRFNGAYDGRWYPQAYTDAEWQHIASYMDDATIRYMLTWEPSRHKRTWSGVDFFLVDRDGNVGYCDNFRPEHYSFGNILSGTFRAHAWPRPFPCPPHVSDGTVDGVANFVELNYDQLDEGNNVLAFAKQGRVYATATGIHYGNRDTDFNDPWIRASYGFEPRTLHDCLAVVCRGRGRLDRRWKSVARCLLPKTLTCPETHQRIRTAIADHVPLARRGYRRVRAALSRIRPQAP